MNMDYSNLTHDPSRAFSLVLMPTLEAGSTWVPWPEVKEVSPESNYLAALFCVLSTENE